MLAIFIALIISIKRPRPNITDEKKLGKTLIQFFVMSHFPLVWYFTSAKQLKKIERIPKRALRFITDDYISEYETFLANAAMTSLHICQIQNLRGEIYKTLSVLNPNYLQRLFERNS